MKQMYRMPLIGFAFITMLLLASCATDYCGTPEDGCKGLSWGEYNLGEPHHNHKEQIFHDHHGHTNWNHVNPDHEPPP